MGRLKDKKSPDKIEIPKTKPVEKISFNFKYITSNKTYGLKYFCGDCRNSEKALSELFNKLEELSKITLTDAKANGKIQGCEPLKYSKFNLSFQQIMDNTDIISKDSSLEVFRFCQNNYRLICKPDIIHTNLLYIIGFDFNYSAYNHG